MRGLFVVVRMLSAHGQEQLRFPQTKMEITRDKWPRPIYCALRPVVQATADG